MAPAAESPTFGVSEFVGGALARAAPGPSLHALTEASASKTAAHRRNADAVVTFFANDAENGTP